MHACRLVTPHSPPTTGSNHCQRNPIVPRQVRREIAGKVLEDVLEALRTDIDIAVFDAANCTRARRRWIRQQVQDAGLYAQVREWM
jgi:hypothetical protein